MKIILASQSPYRKELLQRLNLSFECHAPEIDEKKVWESIGSPREAARKLSQLKATSIFHHHSKSIVIGSDQIVSLDNKVFGKPKTPQVAIKQLSELQGKNHSLITAVCIKSSDREIIFSNETALTIRKDLTPEQIKRYVELDSPLNCAGSYKIESLGISLFEKIETTDFTSIIGLPLIQLSKHLNELGVKVP